MQLTVNNNLPSLNAQHAQTQQQRALDRALAALASGQRVNSAADDAAGLAISQTLTAQINGNNQAINNANDGISLTQTAEGALGQLQSNTQQLQELAIQAGNPTLNAANRQALQQQADQLTQANSAIVQSTQYNGAPLLTGGQGTTFQVGADGQANNQVTVPGQNLNAAPGSGGLNSYNANLGATGTIDLSSQAAALASQQSLGNDLNTLNNNRATLGAASNRFEAAINNLGVATENTAAANSRIIDTDYAAATAELTRQRILGQSNLLVQSQANIGPRSALTLLG